VRYYTPLYMATSTTKAIGNTTREIGILLFVFGPLEALLKSDSPSDANFYWAFGSVLFGFILIVMGIALEGEPE
jgi:hypothetical protein